MTKRDRRQTPIRASLTAGWPDAVPESTEVKAQPAQAWLCEPTKSIPDTASAFYLGGEGTSGKSKDLKDITRVIPKQLSKNKSRKDQRNN